MDILKFHGRKKPYTEIGIRRVKCAKCGKKPSLYSWSSCANGNRQLPVCAECDIKLNELVVKFFAFANGKRLMDDYKVRVAEESNRRATRGSSPGLPELAEADEPDPAESLRATAKAGLDKACRCYQRSAS